MSGGTDTPAASPPAEPPPQPPTPADRPTSGEYYFTHGFRCVVPYQYVFETHVKGRWVGQGVVDMFAKEFPHHDREYYTRCVEEGRIRLDGAKVAPDATLLHGMKVAHEMHRHETPILDRPIRVLGQDEHFFAIDKPSSIPVHPCGRFAKNSVVSILRSDHGYPKTLYPVHRLDKATSGVLLFAKSAAQAEHAGKILRREAPLSAEASQKPSGGVSKIYLARVAGAFPEGDSVECDYPIYCADPKKGHMKCILPGETNRHSALLGVAEKRRELQQELLQYKNSKATPSAEPQEGGGDAAAAAADAPPAAAEEGSGERDQQPLRGNPKKRKQEQQGGRNAGRSYEAKMRKKEVFRQLSNSEVGDAKLIPREAKTLFRRVCLLPGGAESIVECRPLTGRTHQIRVHLLALGYPIVDDALYNPDPVSVEVDAGVGGSSSSGGAEAADSGSRGDGGIPAFPQDHLCKECAEGGEGPIVDAMAASLKEPSSAMCICLHAQSYDFSDGDRRYKFEAALPSWAVGVTLPVSGEGEKGPV